MVGARDDSSHTCLSLLGVYVHDVNSFKDSGQLICGKLEILTA